LATDGFLSMNSSKEVLSGCHFVDRKFRIPQAAWTASSNRWCGKSLSSNI
jgi:hypothetical protein